MMRTILSRLVIAAALALSLAGCAGTPAGDALRAVTATYTNPVGPVDIYRVKNTYAAALQIVVSYREYCWSKPYAALMADPVSKPICEHRRAIVRTAQSTRVKARAAITAAENFIASNPTLNAATAVAAAWQAVTDFQNSIPTK